MLSKAFIVVIAIAISAAMQDAAGAPPGTLPERDFKNWALTCDNGHQCIAMGHDAALNYGPNVIVFLQREAGPEGAALLEVLAQEPIDLAHSRFDGKPFTTASSDWKQSLGDANDVYPYRWVTRSPEVIASWLDAARNAQAWIVQSPDPDATDDQTSISLIGLSAALLAMDEFQGRLQTVSAWQSKGERPASAVPAAPALPTVRKPASRPLPLGKSEARRLIAAVQKKFASDIRDCAREYGDDGDKEAVATRSRENAAMPLSASEALIALSCQVESAYNHTSLLYRVSRRAPYHASRIDFGSEANSGLNATSKANELSEATYDDNRGQLESFAKARGLGDCGEVTAWSFDGANFQLIGIRMQGACIGLPVDDWPWLYRTQLPGEQGRRRTQR